MEEQKQDIYEDEHEEVYAITPKGENYLNIIEIKIAVKVILAFTMLHCAALIIIFFCLLSMK